LGGYHYDPEDRLAYASRRPSVTRDAPAIVMVAEVRARAKFGGQFDTDLHVLAGNGPPGYGRADAGRARQSPPSEKPCETRLPDNICYRQTSTSNHNPREGCNPRAGCNPLSGGAGGKNGESEACDGCAEGFEPSIGFFVFAERTAMYASTQSVGVS